MKKDTASPKQTSGSGFAYEDKVAAYFLVWMLAKCNPFSKVGIVERIDCQVGVDGWEEFDDIIVSTSVSEVAHQYAFSVKSNLQYTKKSAPAQMVHSSWSLFLKEKPFNRELDSVGLITIPHPNPPKQAIHSLLRKAHVQQSSQLDARILSSGYASEPERSIYNSFRKPKEFETKDQWLPGEVLSRTLFLELDFETSPSDTESTMLFMCSHLSLSGSQSDALGLWNFLCKTAQDIRAGGGGISTTELIDKVKPTIELRQLSSFSSDIRLIEQWTADELNTVKTTISGHLEIDREEVVNEVLGKFSANKMLGLIGTSGTGKTAIAKQIADSYREVGDVLWLKGERIKSGYIQSLTSLLCLQHPIQQVVKNSTRKSGLIIIDSVERLRDESDFEELRWLSNTLSLITKGTCWKILVTCKEEDWDKFQLNWNRVLGVGSVWNYVAIKYPSSIDLSEIWEHYPQLRDLSLRPHLHNIMCNLKVIDLLANALNFNSNLDASHVLGESELIKWYWQHVVISGDHGIQRSVVMQKVASKTADAGIFEQPASEFSAEELNTISSSADLLVIDTERSTVAFTHDILSEWSRFHHLLSNETKFKEFCSTRYSNPHWHVAIRNYGIYLLESDHSGTRWKEVYDELPDLQNAFIESFIFSSNAGQLISNAWSILKADKCYLLTAFLKRFQFVASIPNPTILDRANELNVDVDYLRTWERVPLWPYWLPVLQVLNQHKDDVIDDLPVEVSKISRTWLQFSKNNWRGREEATNLVIGIVSKIIKDKYRYYLYDDEIAPFKALLCAYDRNSPTVEELILKLSALVEPSKEDGELYEEYLPVGTIITDSSLFSEGDREILEPWPDGPMYSVSEGFRKACMESSEIETVMLDNPELAKKIILALCIEERPQKVKYPDHHRNLLRYKMAGIENDMEYYPAFYTKGCFLRFLRISPDIAISTILRLIDFSTERWMESNYEGSAQRASLELRINGTIRYYFGDDRVFSWYHGVPESNLLCSALMALEKWLYDQIDSDHDIDSWINKLLLTSNSMAIIGVLCEVGRYKNSLFSTSLKPVLFSLVPYYMETHFSFNHTKGLSGVPYSMHDGEWFNKLTCEWNQMPHRDERLIDTAFKLFIEEAEMQEEFSKAKSVWEQVPDSGNKLWDKSKKEMIAYFTLENWKIDIRDNGSTTYEFITPDELKPDPEAAEKAQQNLMLITIPMECRKFIKDSIDVTDDDASQILQRAKEIYKIPNEAVDPEVPHRAVDSLFGLIAVLFTSKYDWLVDNEISWCLRVFDEVLDSPPAWREFDLPESIGEDTWEHFGSEIAVIDWIHNPSSKQSLFRISKLVTAKHYSASMLLIKRAYDSRSILKERFWMLLNYIIDWASFRFELNRYVQSERPQHPDKWINEAQRKFQKDRYSAEIGAWGKKSIKDGILWTAHYRTNRHTDELIIVPKLDEELIRYCFNDIFHLSEASTDSERQLFLDFWDQAYLVTLTAARLYDEDRNLLDYGNDKLPRIQTQFEDWMMQRLSMISIQLKETDGYERYWSKTFDLGTAGESWIERFLRHWFTHAKNLVTADIFIDKWKILVNYCLHSEAWTTAKWSGSCHKETLWLRLLGVSSFSGSLWSKEDAEPFISATDEVKLVAKHILTSPYEINSFMGWVTEPCAESLRLELLPTVSTHLLKHADCWWERNISSTLIISYLKNIWSTDKNNIQADKEKIDFFRQLLHKACKQNDPLALDFHNQITNKPN